LRWSLVIVLRGLATDAPVNPDGTRQVKTDRAELAQRLGVTPRTISRLLKSRSLEGQRPWRIISPENEQAQYLSLFILRLRYRAVREGHATRRTGLLLDVLMEDPLTPSDQQAASRIVLPSEGALVIDAKGQNVSLHDEGVKGQNVPLHEESVKGQIVSLPGAKGQNIPLQPASAKGQNLSSQSAKGQNVRGNVNVNELTRYIEGGVNLQLTSKRRIRTELRSVVTMAEELLSDYHSTAMLYKVLLALYPDHLRLFTEAVGEALTVGQEEPEANLGAIFVATLKELAGEAGVELGLRGS
jgi:transcriptional regulator with XRE-family HTH domain